MTPGSPLEPRVGAALAAVLVVALAWWARKTHRITHPSFPTQSVETSTYRASYPAHWEPIDPADPRLGERELLFINHREQRGAGVGERWDRLRLHMAVRDEGAGFPSLDGLIAKLLKDAERPGPLKTWRLANGVAAKTWTEQPAAADIPSVMRWLAFQGSNGRYYSAGFPVPSERLTRDRYEFIFKSILGSMEFKPRP
ncbi:MAG: hypothetical protein HY927_11460 [Elusimicrobia bacterium]|nr:hypothetical protein [Elusimicrobiota bacterium]